MFTVTDSLTGQPVSDHPTFEEACRAIFHYQITNRRAAHVVTTTVTLTSAGFRVSA